MIRKVNLLLLPNNRWIENTDTRADIFAVISCEMIPKRVYDVYICEKYL